MQVETELNMAKSKIEAITKRIDMREFLKPLSMISVIDIHVERVLSWESE